MNNFYWKCSNYHNHYIFYDKMRNALALFTEMCNFDLSFRLYTISKYKECNSSRETILKNLNMKISHSLYLNNALCYFLRTLYNIHNYFTLHYLLTPSLTENWCYSCFSRNPFLKTRHRMPVPLNLFRASNFHIQFWICSALNISQKQFHYSRAVPPRPIFVFCFFFNDDALNNTTTPTI